MGALSGKFIFNVSSLKNKIKLGNNVHYTNFSIHILEPNFSNHQH